MQYKQHRQSDYEEEMEPLEESWSEAEAALRSEYAKKESARAWEEIADEYRYGWRLRRRFKGDWTTVEPDIRHDWEQNVAEEGRSWDDVRENVRRGWERGKAKHRHEA